MEEVPGFGSVWTEEEALRAISKVAVLCIAPIRGREEGEKKSETLPVMPSSIVSISLTEEGLGALLPRRLLQWIAAAPRQ